MHYFSPPPFRTPALAAERELEVGLYNFYIPFGPADHVIE